ncbi:MAG: 3-hexulose-6-phosphate synthase [Firmicutes bacterium]|nr:3-hexulose-6-phosphate synthase [Bacillota bacterium]
MRENVIRLQAALDMYALEDAVRAAQNLVDVVDILEVGTPLLLSAGLQAVRRIRETARDIPLVVDAKIMDGGYSAARHAFGAGADIVTVLGAAADETVAETMRAAESAGGKIMVDLINVPDPGARIRRLAGLGAHCFLLHLPSDLAVRGGQFDGPEHGAELVQYEVAVAGGLNADNLGIILPLKPQIVIVGSAIYKAHDPRAEALKIKRRLMELEG